MFCSFLFSNCFSEKYLYKIHSKNFSIDEEIKNHIDDLRAILYFNGEDVDLLREKINSLQSQYGAIYLFDLIRTFTNSKFIRPVFYFEDNCAVFEADEKFDISDSLIFIFNKNRETKLYTFQISDLYLTDIEFSLVSIEKL